MEANIALDKLKKICSRQEKCPADVISYLKRWDVELQNHSKIIDQLKADKFIDENRYVFAFVRDKIKFDHWGTVKIKMMLRQKGISDSITEGVIKGIDKNAYHRMIEAELKKKRNTLKGTPYEIWAKLARHGSSRGYAMEDMEPFL